MGIMPLPSLRRTLPPPLKSLIVTRVNHVEFVIIGIKPGEDCSLHVSYQEGSSWSAFQGRDVTYLGGPVAWYFNQHA